MGVPFAAMIFRAVDCSCMPATTLAGKTVTSEPVSSRHLHDLPLITNVRYVWFRLEHEPDAVLVPPTLPALPHFGRFSCGQSLAKWSGRLQLKHFSGWRGGGEGSPVVSGGAADNGGVVLASVPRV